MNRLPWYGTIVLALVGVPAVAQEPLLWGGLKPGPHPVGYRYLYQLDHTRQYDPEYSADPAQPPVHRPRPILICVWYPAKAGGQSMAYREYLDIPSDDAAVAPFAKRLMPQIRNVVCEEAVGRTLNTVSPAEAAAFERLLTTTTFAIKGAPAAIGRHPVVLYHPGLNGSYADNSVLFEYLVSHGYVVLSSEYHERDASSVTTSGELTTSFRDMEFLARYARDLAFAEAGRVAVIGHSYGAYAALAWQAEPSSSVRAVVTLDSGLEYASLDHPGIEKLKAHFQANKDNFRAATLRVASRNKNPDFTLLEPYLEHAPRYEATVTSLEHNDYLTHGAVRPALMPEKWPDVNQTRRTSYDRLCEHILQFLNDTLKQRADAHEFLQRSLRDAVVGKEVHLRFRAAVPAPPTTRQLYLYTQRYGFDKAIELLRPFPQPEGRMLGVGMLMLRECDAKQALAYLTLAAKAYPTRAEIQACLGKALARTGDRTDAVAAYRRCLELLPLDTTNNEQWKTYWKREVEKALKEMAGSDRQPSHREPRFGIPRSDPFVVVRELCRRRRN